MTKRQLADAHILGQARLRQSVGDAIGGVWRALPGYDRVDVERFLSGAVPIVQAGQRQSVAFTEAFLARAVGRTPRGVATDRVLAAARNGVDPREVYRRPFVTVWSALGAGTKWTEAVNEGLTRATSSAAMDVQLAMRQTLVDVGIADEAIQGFERVADAGACMFCQEVDGAQFQTDDPMPLHNNCGCGVEPIEYTRGRSLMPTKLPESVAVHEHGELGPVLADPAHDFTSESQL